MYIVGCNEQSELHLYLRSACTLYLILTSVLRAGCRPLWFVEVSPSQEGEQAGDKTFGVICQRERVFPKSLAKPRSGGETPSRTESSCPARRSRADNVLSDKDVTQPLTLTLSHKGRGYGYRGRLRSANRPYSPPIDPKPYPPRGEGIVPRCNALRLLAPYLSPTRGEGTVTADDYAALIDPTG